MNATKHTLHAAMTAVMALGLTAAANAHADSAKGKEKCYGVAKAGKNSCANLTDTHACAGMATKDNDPTEWTLVAKGTCAKLGGMSFEQAKAALAKATEKKGT